MQPDKEEFQAWMDSPMTKWVRDKLRLKAQETAQQQQEMLLNSAVTSPLQWSEAQPRAAHLLGLCEGLMQIVDLEFEQLEGTDE